MGTRLKLPTERSIPLPTRSYPGRTAQDLTVVGIHHTISDVIPVPEISGLYCLWCLEIVACQMPSTSYP